MNDLFILYPLFLHIDLTMIGFDLILSNKYLAKSKNMGVKFPLSLILNPEFFFQEENIELCRGVKRYQLDILPITVKHALKDTHSGFKIGNKNNL